MSGKKNDETCPSVEARQEAHRQLGETKKKLRDREGNLSEKINDFGLSVGVSVAQELLKLSIAADKAEQQITGQCPQGNSYYSQFNRPTQPKADLRSK